MSFIVPSTRGRAIRFPLTVGSNRSYPVQLELSYKVVRDGQFVEHGNGRTRHFSSSQLVFAANDSLPIGPVELAVDWPFLLGGVCPLQLVVFGHVLHGSDKAVTVSIDRHEFRTRRSQKLASTIPPESHVTRLRA